MGNEVNCICSIDILDALREAAQLVREALHPDGAVLVKFYEVPELEGLPCLVVEDCSGGFFVGEFFL